MDKLVKFLRLGAHDMRSPGNTRELVRDVLQDHGSVDVLVRAVQTGDKYVRMRAMDALQKISVEHPELLQPFVPDLLGCIAKIPQQEVQWHVAQIIPMLQLTSEQQERAHAICRAYLAAQSRIVQAWALTALVRLGQMNPSYRQEGDALLEQALKSDSAAVRTRAELLVGELCATSASLTHRGQADSKLRPFTGL